ncbi:MAG: hypothetical protein PV344_01045, partial [Anaplasma sp.]|nr:hypothetical protein [Anaplasma sp.]
ASFQFTVIRADFYEQSWYCYPKGDYFSLYRYVSEFDWSIVLGDMCAELCTSRLTETLKQALDMYVPKTISRKTKYPKWFSKSLRQCLRRKLHYHRLFKKTGLNKWYEMFSQSRALAKKLYKQDKQKQENADEISKNRKMLMSRH